MPSVIDICNMALDELGARPITSLTDGNKTANLCNRNYPLVRDEVQRNYPWRRLTRRTELPADAAAPTFGYDYSYTLPAGCLKLLEVFSNEYEVYDYALEGDAILTDYAAPLQIRYIKREEDTTRWDSIMVTAVAARLRSVLAEPVTQNPDKRNFAIAAYEEIMNQAKRIDSQEGTGAKVNRPDTWEQARYADGSPVNSEIV